MQRHNFLNPHNKNEAALNSLVELIKQKFNLLDVPFAKREGDNIIINVRYQGHDENDFASINHKITKALELFKIHKLVVEENKKFSQDTNNKITLPASQIGKLVEKLQSLPDPAVANQARRTFLK